jgi:hypothetical protein
MMHADQKGAGVAINSNELEIDLEFLFIESKNSSRSEIEFEIKNIFNFSSNVGKSDKKLYLIFRLYTAISI